MPPAIRRWAPSCRSSARPIAPSPYSLTALATTSRTDLLPGLYTLKVTAPSFLPALREKVGIRPGASINVNVTLNTLLGVMQLGPIRTQQDDDDWKWTLRSVANRPILRIFNDPTLAAEKQTHELRGTLSFFSGSAADGYGSGSDMSTGFTLERSVFSDGRVDFSGNVGYGVGLPAAALRASYSHRMPNGSEPSVALTMRRFAASDPNLHNAALQALALSANDSFSVGDVLEFKFGSELQTIQFLGPRHCVSPLRLRRSPPLAQHGCGIQLRHVPAQSAHR